MGLNCGKEGAIFSGRDRAWYGVCGRRVLQDVKVDGCRVWSLARSPTTFGPTTPASFDAWNLGSWTYRALLLSSSPFLSRPIEGRTTWRSSVWVLQCIVCTAMANM
jgi:hypothetical protein